MEHCYGTHDEGTVGHCVRRLQHCDVMLLWSTMIEMWVTVLEHEATMA